MSGRSLALTERDRAIVREVTRFGVMSSRPAHASGIVRLEDARERAPEASR